MTQFPDLFAALNAPFEAEEIRARSQAGRQLQYITARTVMNRLDNVLGPENWWDEYTPGEHSVLCRLTIRLPDGATLTKADAGGYAGMPDSGDDDKSGFSDAFKRAAVKFGVGRLLYRDGVPAFAVARESGSQSDASALPRRDNTIIPSPAADPREGHDRGRPGTPSPTAGGPPMPSPKSSTPRSGRALFAWVKDKEQQHEIVLLKFLNNWGRLQDFPGRMIEWDADQVALAHAEAVRKLESAVVGVAS